MVKMTTKVPPQAVDLERAVLGASLLMQTGVDAMMEVIQTADVFYDVKHQNIYAAIRKLYNSNKPVDLLTVVDQLDKNKKLSASGGQYYLVELVNSVSSSAHTEFHSRILLQKYMARKVISICNDGIVNAYNPDTDVFELLDSITSSIDALTDTRNSGHVSLSWEEAVLDIPKRVELLTRNQGEVIGLPTGLTAIDKHFSGWQPEDLVIIGADSGMGKTALVLSHMIAAAKDGNAVGMFSMEMSVIQLAIRGIATESNYHMNQLVRRGFEHEEYFEGLKYVVNKVKDYPIYIDDKPALTVPEMKRKARAMYRKHGIKLLVVDFVQMFSGDKDPRINISEAARELKNIAKELKIPVIALSQLSREVRKARYCIPSKHHLKESSAIEEAADVIGLLYRPGYYGYSFEKHYDLWSELGLTTDENACLLIAKNRNGALGNIGLHFVENKTKYVNPVDSYEYYRKETKDHFM